MPATVDVLLPRRPLDGRVLDTDDLAGCDVLFCATGITDGRRLHGARGNISQSLVLAGAGSGVRWIETDHRAEA